MIWIRAALLIAVMLGFQAGLAQLWPSAQTYVDFHLIPVVVMGIVGTQRQAMLVGMASGLLADAWFQTGMFGLNGFKKTLLGWFLGGLGSRVDLNGAPGRFAAGALLSVADGALDPLLRNLLDRPIEVGGIWVWVIRAFATGLGVVWTFSVIEWFKRRKFGERWF